MSYNARKLYIIVVLSLLIFMNWCCFMTDPNWAVALAALMTSALFFNRIADRLLHRLQERKHLWATLILALICYCIPYMNSIFHVLYTLSMASVFYPSEHVLRIKDETDSIIRPLELLRKILRNYF